MTLDMSYLQISTYNSTKLVRSTLILSHDNGLDRSNSGKKICGVKNGGHSIYWVGSYEIL